MLRSVVLLSLISSPAFAQPRYAIEAVEAKTVEAVMSYTIESKSFAADRWMVYVPKPPELPGQVKIKTNTTPPAKLVTEKSPIARPVFLFDQAGKTPALAHRIEVELKFEATLLKRSLVPLAKGATPPKVTPLKDAERKYYLASSSLVDHDAALFREWLDKHKLRRSAGESEMDFAARVLEQIRSQFEYGYEAGQDQRASLACSRGKTDCGGMSFIFAGALRASGIPARSLLGRMARPRKEGTKPSDLDYDNPHVTAEFFVPDLGWVPVDPTSVEAEADQPASSFLGKDNGNLIVLHVDVDLMLPFRDRVERAPHMQISPYFQAYGRGQFDAVFRDSQWNVKKIK